MSFYPVGRSDVSVRPLDVREAATVLDRVIEVLWIERTIGTVDFDVEVSGVMLARGILRHGWTTRI